MAALQTVRVEDICVFISWDEIVSYPTGDSKNLSPE